MAEGPVWWKAGGWWKDGGFLLFSDNANNKRYKWHPKEGLSLYREPTNNANGLTRDRQGRLVACEHDTRRVTREELDGSITVVANNYRGMKLNRPNDIVVKSDGAIYFTDPVSMWLKDTEVDVAGVYRVSPDLGQINLLVRDFGFPNGLAFSPDEKILYVNDTFKAHIRAFRLDPLYGSGFLDMSSERGFLRIDRRSPGRSRRYEMRPGRQCVLHRAGRDLDHQSQGRASRHHPDWRGVVMPPICASVATTGPPCSSPPSPNWAACR